MTHQIRAPLAVIPFQGLGLYEQRKPLFFPGDDGGAREPR